MKKILFKNFLAITLFVSICGSLLFSYTANAKESSTDTQILATYDIEEGGAQTSHTTDQDGNNIIITIEEIESNARISNGSYKVTYEHTLFWTAGFSVTISNNKITSAYSPFYSVACGSISSPSLTLNSSTKATYKFIHKSGLLSTTTGVVATISGTTLNVSRL